MEYKKSRGSGCSWQALQVSKQYLCKTTECAYYHQAVYLLSRLHLCPRRLPCACDTFILCMYVCMYVCRHVCVYVSTYLWMQIFIYVFMFMSLCVYFWDQRLISVKHWVESSVIQEPDHSIIRYWLHRTRRLGNWLNLPLHRLTNKASW